VFGKPAESTPPPVDLQALHAKIGQLMLENGFLEGGIAEHQPWQFLLFT